MICGCARSAASVARADCRSLKATADEAFSPMMPARVSMSRIISRRNVMASYAPSAMTVSSSATRLVSMKPVRSLVRIERSRKRAKAVHSKRITTGMPLASFPGMIGTKIQAVVLSGLLLMPAESAFANIHKKHSRVRGAVVGAVVGALVKGKKGAVVGAVVGNAVQAERHREYKNYKRRYHKRR